MSAPVKTWTSLPANAEADAALRVAAAGVMGWTPRLRCVGCYEEEWRPGKIDHGEGCRGRREKTEPAGHKVFWNADGESETVEEQPYYESAGLLQGWNRDDLALVFAAARLAPPFQASSNRRINWLRHADKAWLLALKDPRAALCALLDLLSVPVPQELHQ